MMQSGFSTLGLTRKTHSSIVWFSSLESDGPIFATNAKIYSGDLQIHSADGKRLHIVSVLDIPHSLPMQHVFFSYFSIVFHLLDN